MDLLNSLNKISRHLMDCVEIDQRNRSSIFHSLTDEEYLLVANQIGISITFKGSEDGSSQIPDTAAFEPNQLLSIIPTESQRNKVDRCIGAYMGMFLGDSIGAPLEFTDISDVRISHSLVFNDSVTGIAYPNGQWNQFRLHIGQWTDDASMGSCIADSLLVHRKVVGRDIRSRFWNWWMVGYNNAFFYSQDRNKNRSVGLGGNIAKSIDALTGKSYSEISDKYEALTQDSGNGGLMRLAPVPVFFSDKDPEIVMQYSRLSSETTHPGHLASRTAEFLGYIIHQAINREGNESAKVFVDRVVATYLISYLPESLPGSMDMRRLLLSAEPQTSQELCWNWKSANLKLEKCLQLRGSSYNGYPISKSYFGSFCMDALAIALHSFYHSEALCYSCHDPFESTLKRCIDYLGDCDSTGSIAGQIAGAFYGVTRIRPTLIANCLRWDRGENILRALMLTPWFQQAVGSASSDANEPIAMPSTTPTTTTAGTAAVEDNRNHSSDNQDKGGSVIPKQDCPHVFSAFDIDLIMNQLHGSFTSFCQDCGKAAKEVWVCLQCNKNLCSRYCESHQENHFMETLFSDFDHPHCLAISYQDLSVWCYACNSYVKHDRLLPMLIRAESIKFQEEEKLNQLNGVQRVFDVGFAYSAVDCSKHCRAEGCFERPQRTERVYDHLEVKFLLSKLRTVALNSSSQSTKAPEVEENEWASLVHSEEYINRIRNSVHDNISLQELSAPDVFVVPDTSMAAFSAVRSIIRLTHDICDGSIGLDRGFALVRPPGHHAEIASPAGFCFLNNVAIAARYAQQQFGAERVMIVDFDIHHGNGCQQIFYEDPTVLHVSIHRQEHGLVSTSDGSQEMAEYDELGTASYLGAGKGLGYNVNIPLRAGDPSKGGLGDADYAIVMESIVIPLLHSFRPQLLLVAAGYDAGHMDFPLAVGGYSVTPEGYASMTRSLVRAMQQSGAALPHETTNRGLVIMSLEGGYSLQGLCLSIDATINGLLSESRYESPAATAASSANATEFTIDFGPHPSTLEVIDEVKRHLKPHWPNV